ncbi:Histidine phosphatase superfamily (branch 1) [Carex littledalei]|uniref:Histidine phosphatase superfamily (Branch 1) n=1 Tax=Carex littledalei TaxID=544730 RepID=A0A833QVB2_9POAL|nr:Histidine phosphatase superfamily (branch 1) [Carex littledalei]
MRHGDRIDHFDPNWVSQAARPWDPVLTDGGKARARATGARLSGLDFPIHRVLVSPFVRCRETAAEVITSLCSVGEIDGQDSPIDPSRVKVSVEYGLCEMLNNQVIEPSVIPKDGDWFPDTSQLEAIFPEETRDHSVTPIYQQIPTYGESVVNARRRFAGVIRSLADKYPHENLLLITHGEAVWVSVQYFYRHVEMFVDYCGFSHLERKISFNSPEAFTSESFNLLTKNNDTGLVFRNLPLP